MAGLPSAATVTATAPAPVLTAGPVHVFEIPAASATVAAVAPVAQSALVHAATASSPDAVAPSQAVAFDLTAASADAAAPAPADASAAGDVPTGGHLLFPAEWADSDSTEGESEAAIAAVLAIAL